ncbi:MAG: prepilin-type N-terminal cleavage/methylation domain-containing protein [Rickettsiales bacterium]|jgi:prepilin-type N-terminal cleavage/methylation domain-containing protein
MNKKTFKPNNKKAFSLIELSIVLIIIGLLIAGVTGGASLIKNASLRSVGTEARGYQTAVNGFFDRYTAYPGDYNSLIPGTFSADTTLTTNATGVFGNNDGQIQYYAPNATNTTADNRLEGNIAWQHLKNDGFVDASFTPGNADITGGALVNTFVLTAASTAVPAVDTVAGMPASKIGRGAGWAFDYVTNHNVIILTGTVTAPTTAASTAAITMTPTAALTPSDARAIDIKSDDGIANAGKIRSVGGNDATTAGTLQNGANIADQAEDGCNDSGGSTATNTAAYSTTNTATACALSFNIDL